MRIEDAATKGCVRPPVPNWSKDKRRGVENVKVAKQKFERETQERIYDNPNIVIVYV